MNVVNVVHSSLTGCRICSQLNSLQVATQAKLGVHLDREPTKLISSHSNNSEDLSVLTSRFFSVSGLVAKVIPQKAPLKAITGGTEHDVKQVLSRIHCPI
jgi:hypothetical protein